MDTDGHGWGRMGAAGIQRKVAAYVFGAVDLGCVREPRRGSLRPLLTLRAMIAAERRFCGVEARVAGGGPGIAGWFLDGDAVGR
jgi:hypothetical protein